MTKIYSTLFLLLPLISCAPKKEKPTTIYVLQDYNLWHVPNAKNSLYWGVSEKNVFDEFLNELIISQQQDHSLITDVYFLRKIKILFKDWSSIELDKDYEIEDLKSECMYVDGVETRKLSLPDGNIRLISKTPDSLTFLFNLSFYESERNKLWLYRGERVFKKIDGYGLRKELLQQHSRVKIEKRKGQ